MPPFAPVLPVSLSLYRRDMSSQGASVMFVLKQASGRAQPGRQSASDIHVSAHLAATRQGLTLDGDTRGCRGHR